MPRAQVYDFTMYILAGMLVVGFICNLMIKPVDPRWFMKEEEVAALQARANSTAVGRAARTASAKAASTAPRSLPG